MDFFDKTFLSRRVITTFWNEVDSSYTMERMYDDYENILITLSDEISTLEFILCKSFNKKTDELLILDKADNYVGFLWRNDKGKKGGTAEGDAGKRRVHQCLKMLEKALATGSIELEVYRNDNSKIKKLPLNITEQQAVSLLNEGYSLDEIASRLNLYTDKKSKLKKNLVRKGILNKQLELLAS